MEYHVYGTVVRTMQGVRIEHVTVQTDTGVTLDYPIGRIDKFKLVDTDSVKADAIAWATKADTSDSSC